MSTEKAGIQTVVDGALGKLAIGVLLTGVFGISAWSLKTMVDHSTSLVEVKGDLAVIRDDVQHLVSSIDQRNVAVDGDIGRVIDAQREVEKEVIQLQQAEAVREHDDRRLAPRKAEPN